MKERKPFQRIYMETTSPKEIRDRFQVELSRSKTEMIAREDLCNMQIAINEHQDSAALKFWAKYGYLAYSNQAEANELFRDTLFKNINNKNRLGVDVEAEVQNKFQQLKQKIGGNL